MRRAVLFVIVSIAVAGCGESSPREPVAAAPTAPSAAPPPPPAAGASSSPAAPAPPAPATEETQPSGPEFPTSPVSPDAPGPIKPDGIVKKAEAGAGRRGRGYGGGMITEPIHQYFHMRQRINFVALEHALKLFKAQYNRNPKSHEEFFERIIKEGSIDLPDLPPGEEYFYDPEKGQLMIRRPAD